MLNRAIGGTYDQVTGLVIVTIDGPKAMISSLLEVVLGQLSNTASVLVS